MSTSPEQHPDPALTHDQLATTMEGEQVPQRELRRRARAWQIYDLSQSAWQSVVVTFVFVTYLTSDLFLDPEMAALGAANPEDPRYLAAQAASQEVIAGLDAIAAVLVAVLAPALGRVADGSGRRKKLFAAFSGLVAATMIGMFFIYPDAQFLFIGALLLAMGNIFSELAWVNYNAMLTQVATEKNVGRVSGIGWGIGYISSIVLLAVLLVLFIQNFGGSGAGIFGIPAGADGDALNIRLAIAAAALWYLVFLIPILLRVPESKISEKSQASVGFFRSYVELWRTLRQLWRTDRKLLQFLLSSAIFRDGMNAIFAWGAVLAAQVYGFASNEIMFFAIAANLAAGLGTLLGGWLDDRIGPKVLIVSSLVAMLVVGLVLMSTPNEKVMFWVLALILCLFVGPVQSSSRSYMARAIPPGHEGELMGLYATTGRAAGWLSNILYFAFIAWLAVPKAGVWGILVTLLVGLVLFITVPARPNIAKLQRSAEH